MTEKLTYIPPEALGRTNEQEQDKIHEILASRGGKENWKHFTPEFVSTHLPETNVDALREQIKLAVTNYQESRVSQPEGWVRINSDLPIGIVHLGDLHLGSIYSDTEEIFRKFRLVKETPNLYCVLMSNLIDNGIPAQYPNNMLVNAIPPDKQVMMIRLMVQDLAKAGKVLAAVTSPCHEGWTIKHTGQDINALIFGFPERQFPILENGGRLHLTIGNQDYLGALFHQVGPYESNFNETHALRQLNRLYLQMTADWVAGAHKHTASVQEVFEGIGKDRKIRVYIRTGSEKGTGEVHDRFIIDTHGITGQPTGQTLWLWPNERRLAAECDFDTAILAHESYYLRGLLKREKPEDENRV